MVLWCIYCLPSTNVCIILYSMLSSLPFIISTGGITSSLRATGHTPVTPPTVQSHNSNSDSSDECTSSGSDSSSDDEGTSPARVLLPPSRAGLSTDQSDDSQTSGSDSDGDERTVKGKGRARGRGRGGGVRSGVRRGGRTPKGRVEKLVPVRTARWVWSDYTLFFRMYMYMYCGWISSVFTS